MVFTIKWASLDTLHQWLKKNNEQTSKLEFEGEMNMANFQVMMDETKALVKEYLANKEKRPSYMLEKQLTAILVELDKMEQARNCHVFYPYYPKGICDSWDFLDPLGSKLLELLDVYRRL